MNENPTTHAITTPSASFAKGTSPHFTRAMVPLDSALYEEIKSLLAGLSNELGMKVNMPCFLRKTIVENWRLQFERYRRLNPCAKGARP